MKDVFLADNIVIVILNYVLLFVVLVAMIKYINFKYIILAPPRLLVKIHHETKIFTRRITWRVHQN